MQNFKLDGGLDLPAIGFGTYLIPDAEAPVAVETAIRTGYRHIDTAQDYGNERGVGEGIRAGLAAVGLTRADLFVTTKFMPNRGEPLSTAADLRASAEASLAKLGMDYVDLFLIHAPFGAANRITLWEEVLQLKAEGKIRAGGVSNYAQRHLQEIADAGLPMPAANQLELHPWCQKPDLIAYMRGHTVQPIAYSSLVPHSGWRHANSDENAKPDGYYEDARVFQEMAAKYGVTEAQFLLGWGVQSGFAVLPKSLSPARIAENLALHGFTITPDDMAAIAKMDRGEGVAWPIGDPLFLMD